MNLMGVGGWTTKCQDVLAFFAQHDVVDRISDVQKVGLELDLDGLWKQTSKLAVKARFDDVCVICICEYVFAKHMMYIHMYIAYYMY